MFTNDDIRQIEERGSSVQTVKDQVERFKKGFPWMKIVAPATPAKGISVLSEAEVEEAGKYYESAEIAGKCKFVPASGAASRMFKDLFSGLDILKPGAFRLRGIQAVGPVQDIDRRRTRLRVKT